LNTVENVQTACSLDMSLYFTRKGVFESPIHAPEIIYHFLRKKRKSYATNYTQSNSSIG